MDEPYSAGLSEFLAYIRSCAEQASMAAEDEKQADAETQDILHTLELDRHSYSEVAHLGKKLIAVRQRRRKAKETQEALLPIVGWAEANRPAVKALERVLGEMRKAEKRQETRIYAQRTHVLTEE